MVFHESYKTDAELLTKVLMCITFSYKLTLMTVQNARIT